ncbi:hypothetical protein ACQP00_20280 [Dactylosporangium sp. CS-047395]
MIDAVGALVDMLWALKGFAVAIQPHRFFACSARYEGFLIVDALSMT